MRTDKQGSLNPWPGNRSTSMCHNLLVHFAKCTHRDEKHVLCGRGRHSEKKHSTRAAPTDAARPCERGRADLLVKRDTPCARCEVTPAEPQGPSRHGGPRAQDRKKGTQALGTQEGQAHPYATQGDPAATLRDSVRRALPLMEEKPPRHEQKDVSGRALRARDGKAKGARQEEQGQSSSRSMFMFAWSFSRVSIKGSDGGGGEKNRTLSTGTRVDRGAGEKRVRFSRSVEVRYFKKGERTGAVTRAESKVA